VFPARLLADPAFVTSMSARFSSWFVERPVQPGYTDAQRFFFLQSKQLHR
jgi:hypothetical protein